MTGQDLEQNTAPMSGQKPTGMRPWLKVLFGLSLALNIAVVGLIAGVALRKEDHDRARYRPPLGVVLFRELSPEHRGALRDATRSARGSHGERRHRSAEALLAAVVADPFDPAELERVLTEQTQSFEAAQSGVRSAWVKQVSAMSQSEREIYADRLRDRLTFRKGHKTGRGWRDKTSGDHKSWKD